MANDRVTYFFEDLKNSNISTGTTPTVEPLTFEKLEETLELIKALVPQKAPADAHCIFSNAGLKIMKNPHLSDDVIIVSESLFDVIFASRKKQNESINQRNS